MGRSKKKTKEAQKRSKKVNSGFEKLPFEIIAYLTHYLSGFDVVRLSSVSRHMYNVLNHDTIWTTLMKREDSTKSKAVTKAAEKLCNTHNMISIEKASYLLHEKVSKNWKKGESQTLFKNVYRMNTNENYLATLTSNQSITESITQPLVRLASYGGWSPFGEIKPKLNYLINVYDLNQISLRKPLHKDVQLSEVVTHKQYMFDLEVVDIYVAEGYLVIIFGSGNRYSDNLDKLVVLDITNGLKEVWSDDESERKDDLFCANIGSGHLQDKQVYHFTQTKFFRIQSYSEAVFVVARLISNNSVIMRMISPLTRFDGHDISSNDDHIIMTGTVAHCFPGPCEHPLSPCVFGWDFKHLENNEYYIDSPLTNYDSPLTSPRHTFRKTALSDGLVYGLLERVALYIWKVDSGIPLNVVEIGKPRIGGRSPLELESKHFLAMSHSDSKIPFLVTINENFQTLTILDRQGNQSLEIGWSKLKCPIKDFRNVILDVLVTEKQLLVYFVDRSAMFRGKDDPVPIFIVFQLPLGN